ncbi:MAG: hypothetical protein SV760_08225, partial [Halobacteria archaeon]|nr:hypothetical protein [Halobacteria archaeon]
MTTWYPTVEWFEEFRDELNSNEEFQRLVADWGASFNGDFLFYIEDIPSDRYRLTDVPEELTLVEGLPDEVLEELPDDTHGMSVFEVYDHLDERDELDEVPDDIVEDLRKVRDIFDDNPTFDEFADTADEIRGCIPNEMGRLLDELREFVTEDHEVFAYMEFYDGECTGVDVLDSLDE